MRHVLVGRVQFARNGDPRAQPVDQDVAAEAVVAPRQAEARQFQRVSGGEVEAGFARDLGAQRGLQPGVGQREAPGAEADAPQDGLKPSALQPDRAAAFQRQRADAVAPPCHVAQAAVQCPGVALRGVIADLQAAGLHVDGLAPQGQAGGQGGRAGILAQGHQQHHRLRRAGVIGRDRAGEVQRFRVDQQDGQRQPPVLAAPALDQHLRLGAEEGGVFGRQEACDVAAQFQPEGGAGGAVLAGLRPDRGAAGHAVLPVRGQPDLGHEVAQRPLAPDLGAHGGAAVEAHEIGEQPARVLVQLQVQPQHGGFVGIGRIHGEGAALAVHAVDGQLGRALAARKVHRAVDRNHRRLADDRLAQFDPARRDAGDADADRQGGQGEFAHLGGAGVPFALRQAGQEDLLGRQFLDLDAPGKKGRAVPLDRAVAQRDPDALGVGDGQFGEGRPRGQRPLEAPDLDLPPGAGQVAFKETGDEALVVLDLGGNLGGLGGDAAFRLWGGRGSWRCRRLLRRDRRDGQQEDEGQGGQKLFHQKACPSPR